MDVDSYWELSLFVTRTLSENKDPHQAVAVILEQLCTSLKWDAGVFWIVDDRRTVLTCAQFWSRNEREFANFEQVSRARDFHIGEGLPGRAWQRKQTISIEDVVSDAAFPRASVATVDGLHGGIAFPIYVSTGILGVMELFKKSVSKEDKGLVDFLQALGGQIGVFLEHARVQSELLDLNSQFLQIAETASDVIVTIDKTSTILYVNSAMEKLLGYRPAELIGQKMTMLMPERMRPRHEAGVARFSKTGKRNIPWDGVTLPGLHKDGTEILLEVSFGEFYRGGAKVFTGFLRPQKQD